MTLISGSHGNRHPYIGLTHLFRFGYRGDAIVPGTSQFPFLIYTDPPTSIFLGKIRTGFIFTLGADENMAKERGFDARIAAHEFILKMIFGNSESLCSFDTYQFDDYSKVFAPRWDPDKKAKRKD